MPIALIDDASQSRPPFPKNVLYVYLCGFLNKVCEKGQARRILDTQWLFNQELFAD